MVPKLQIKLLDLALGQLLDLVTENTIKARLRAPAVGLYHTNRLHERVETVNRFTHEVPDVISH